MSIYINEEALQSSLEACWTQIWLVNIFFMLSPAVWLGKNLVFLFGDSQTSISINIVSWIVHFPIKLFLQSLAPFPSQHMPGHQHSGSQQGRGGWGWTRWVVGLCERKESFIFHYGYHLPVRLMEFILLLSLPFQNVNFHFLPEKGRKEFLPDYAEKDI